MRKSNSSEPEPQLSLATDWRGKAHEVFPELSEIVAQAETPYALWIELYMTFEDAYREPKNEDLIRRIYGYAKWCQAQERSDKASSDLLTCVAVCFHEHIPTFPAACQDVPNWFSLSEVELMKETFGYFLSDKEYEELKDLFPVPKATYTKKHHKTRKKKS